MPAARIRPPFRPPFRHSSDPALLPARATAAAPALHPSQRPRSSATIRAAQNLPIERPKSRLRDHFAALHPNLGPPIAPFFARFRRARDPRATLARSGRRRPISALRRPPQPPRTQLGNLPPLPRAASRSPPRFPPKGAPLRDRSRPFPTPCAPPRPSPPRRATAGSRPKRPAHTRFSAPARPASSRLRTPVFPGICHFARPVATLRAPRRDPPRPAAKSRERTTLAPVFRKPPPPFWDAPRMEDGRGVEGTEGKQRPSDGFG